MTLPGLLGHPPVLWRREMIPIVPAGVAPAATFSLYDPSDFMLTASPQLVATAEIGLSKARNVLLWFQCRLFPQAGTAGTDGRTWIEIQRDGSTIARTTVAPENYEQTMSAMCWIDDAPAGSVTYTVRMWLDSVVSGHNVQFQKAWLHAIDLGHGSVNMHVAKSVRDYTDADVSIAAGSWTTLDTVLLANELSCNVLIATCGTYMPGTGILGLRVQRDGSTVWEQEFDAKSATPNDIERNGSMLWLDGVVSKGAHTYTLQATTTELTWSWARSRMLAAIALRAGRSALAVASDSHSYGDANTDDVYAAPYSVDLTASYSGTPAVALICAAAAIAGGSSTAATYWVCSPASGSIDWGNSVHFNMKRAPMCAAGLRLGANNPISALTGRRLVSAYPGHDTGQRQAAIIVFDAPGDVPTVATNLPDWTLTNATVTTQDDGRSHRLVCTASTGEHKAVSPSPVNASTTDPTTIQVEAQSWAGVVDGLRVSVAACYLDVNLLTGAMIGSSGASGVSVVTNGSGGWIISYVAAIAAAPVVTIQALDGGATSFAGTTADWVQVKMLLPHSITQ